MGGVSNKWNDLHYPPEQTRWVLEVEVKSPCDETVLAPYWKCFCLPTVSPCGLQGKTTQQSVLSRRDSLSLGRKLFLQFSLLLGIMCPFYLLTQDLAHTGQRLFLYPQLKTGLVLFYPLPTRLQETETSCMRAIKWSYTHTDFNEIWWCHQASSCALCHVIVSNDTF